MGIERIICSQCSALQEPEKFLSNCPSCENSTYLVSYQRSFLGLSPGEIAEPLVWSFLGGDIGLALYLMKEGMPSPIYRAKSVIEIGSVSGDEVTQLLQSAPEDAKRLALVLKRREVEAAIGPGRGLCSRCGLVFTRYGNSWNEGGLCSRKCLEVASKAKDIGHV